MAFSAIAGPTAASVPPDETLLTPVEAGIQAGTCFLQTAHWVQLSAIQKSLLSKLGWTAVSWESDDPADYPAVQAKSWEQLSNEERAINRSLGMTRQTWDNPATGCYAG